MVPESAQAARASQWVVRVPSPAAAADYNRRPLRPTLPLNPPLKKNPLTVTVQSLFRQIGAGIERHWMMACRVWLCYLEVRPSAVAAEARRHDGPLGRRPGTPATLRACS